jgi:hypothetical protein
MKIEIRRRYLLPIDSKRISGKIIDKNNRFSL